LLSDCSAITPTSISSCGHSHVLRSDRFTAWPVCS